LSNYEHITQTSPIDQRPASGLQCRFTATVFAIEVFGDAPRYWRPVGNPDVRTVHRRRTRALAFLAFRQSGARDPGLDCRFGDLELQTMQKAGLKRMSNNPAAGQTGMTPRFAIGYHCPGLPEPGREGYTYLFAFGRPWPGTNHHMRSTYYGVI